MGNAIAHIMLRAGPVAPIAQGERITTAGRVSERRLRSGVLSARSVRAPGQASLRRTSPRGRGRSRARGCRPLPTELELTRFDGHPE
jgi:hypothetical protein